jgi:hypothetical protein
MAIANYALQILVISNDYWKTPIRSSMRGIPIINAEILLQSVVPSLVGTQTCFPTPNTTTIEDVQYAIQVQYIYFLQHAMFFAMSAVLAKPPI